MNIKTILLFLLGGSIFYLLTGDASETLLLMAILGFLDFKFQKEKV